MLKFLIPYNTPLFDGESDSGSGGGGGGAGAGTGVQVAAEDVPAAPPPARSIPSAPAPPAPAPRMPAKTFREIMLESEPERPAPGQPDTGTTPKPAAAPKPVAVEPAEPAEPTEPETPAKPAAEPTEPAAPAAEESEEEEFSWDDKPVQEEAETSTGAAEQGDKKPDQPHFNTPEEEAALFAELERQLASDTGNKEARDQFVGKFLQTNRGKAIYNGYKYKQQLEQTLGRETGNPPTMEEIRTMADRSEMFDAMQHDLDLFIADPSHEGGAKFLNYWLGVDRNGNPRPGAPQLLAALPSVIAQADGQLYDTLAEPVIQRFINTLYDRIEQTTDKRERTNLINTATGLDYHVNGTYRKIDAENARVLPVEETAEQRRVRELEEQHRNQQNEYFSRQWATHAGNVRSAVRSAVEQDADRALAPRKEALSGDPKLYEAIRSRFIQEALGKVESERRFQTGWRNIMDLDAANMKRGTLNPSESIERAISFYRPISRKAMRELRGSYIRAGALTNGAKSSADRERQIREAAQGQKTPQTSSSQAVAMVEAVPKLVKREGESAEQFRARAFNTLLTPE